MNRKVRGFTLIECVVAMAVLAIATLLMASLYGMIAKVNEMNHRTNESLANTIDSAELMLDKTDTDKVYSVLETEAKDSTKVTFTEIGTPIGGSAGVYTGYSNVYVVYSEDSASHSNEKYSDPDKDPIKLRYKYFD